MRVTHIIGNGFDISSGLSTTATELLSELKEVVEIAPLPPQGIKVLANDIQDKGIGYWSDFEAALGEATSYKAFSSSPDLFLEAKNEFERILSELLRARVGLLDDNFVEENAESCIKSLSNIQTSMQAAELAAFDNTLKPIPDRWNYSHSFITLNYTPTLELLVDRFDRSQAFTAGGSAKGDHYLSHFVYAHGSFDDAPICGVNDKDQIKNEAFRENPDVSAMLIKGNAQQDYGTQHDKRALELIESSSLICTFGVSFGKSDKRWWTAVLNRLINSRNSALILFDKAYRSDHHLTWDKRKARTDAIRRFYAASEASNEMQEIISNRVFVLPSERFFVVEKPLTFSGLPEKDLMAIANRLYGNSTIPERRLAFS